MSTSPGPPTVPEPADATWRLLRRGLGVAALVLSVGYLAGVVSGDVLAEVGRRLLAEPVGLIAATAAYATAFLLRAWAWRAVLVGLTLGHSWAALHVALLGNHVLPLRLGEALRVTCVRRRTRLATVPVLASALTLRLADLLTVLLLALAVTPALVFDLAPGWALLAVVVLGAALALALGWLRRLGPVALRPVRPRVAAATLLAWLLEATVVWQVAHSAGIALSPHDAVAVTAVTIAAQTLAITPGGFGSYEAAATAALTAVGVEPATAFAIALATHAVKTAYALAVGALALLAPAPSYWGHLRLPAASAPRPARWTVSGDAPVVAVIPVHDEQETVGDVVRRLPRSVDGRPVLAVVVDDGSTDASAVRAARAGAVVVQHPRNLGLGAALRRGLAEASRFAPAAVVYLDGDGEYAPEELAQLAGPVLAGRADYVVGSRFAGHTRHMQARRRLGNQVLTAWVRWLTRRADLTDGQSGYRAFSPAAAAHGEIGHDYNYAQVLTLDLVGKGYAYAEVPITYAFRESGTSFVRLGHYLRTVVPAVHRELNAAVPPGPTPPAGQAPEASTSASLSSVPVGAPSLSRGRAPRSSSEAPELATSAAASPAPTGSPEPEVSEPDVSALAAASSCAPSGCSLMLASSASSSKLVPRMSSAG